MEFQLIKNLIRSNEIWMNKFEWVQQKLFICIYMFITNVTSCLLHLDLQQNYLLWVPIVSIVKLALKWHHTLMSFRILSQSNWNLWQWLFDGGFKRQQKMRFPKRIDMNPLYLPIRWAQEQYMLKNWKWKKLGD